MQVVDTLEALEALYGARAEASVAKVADHLTSSYRAVIEASPFAVLATVGPDGVDCSPRGDRPGFVCVVDQKTVILPDRRGNNRIDSLRNIVRDPRVALLFLVPGAGKTLRVNGNAVISVDESLLETFAVDGRRPRTALVLSVHSVYFQCARAILRSRLWDADAHRREPNLPTPGTMLAELTDGRVGGERYDAEWPARAAGSML